MERTWLGPMKRSAWISTDYICVFGCFSSEYNEGNVSWPQSGNAKNTAPSTI